jgi:hypothetical protein
MGNLSDAVRAGLEATKADLRARASRPGGDQFVAAERPVICPQCGGDRFDTREALLNSTVLTAVGLDWLDRSATAMICTRCTHITFFAKRPERAP